MRMTRMRATMTQPTLARVTLSHGHSCQRRSAALSPVTPLPGFLNSLTGPLDHYGYWTVALLLLLENIGVPVVPGEFAMIGGAIFAGTGRAGLNIVVVAVIAAVCCFAGAE